MMDGGWGMHQTEQGECFPPIMLRLSKADAAHCILVIVMSCTF